MPTICMESVYMCVNEKVNSWHIDKIIAFSFIIKLKIPIYAFVITIFYVFGVVLYILKDSDDEIHIDKQQ